jgi:excisionase family DNA binding protein
MTPEWTIEELSQPEVMNIRQAASYLGISSDSLYKYASKGVVPSFRLGSRWKFKRSVLDDWMALQSTRVK